MKNLMKTASAQNFAGFVFKYSESGNFPIEDEKIKPQNSNENTQLAEANENKEKLIKVTIIEIPAGNNPKTIGFGKSQNIDVKNNYIGWVNGGITNSSGDDWQGEIVSYGENTGKIQPKYPDENDGNFGYSNNKLDVGGNIGTFNGVMGLNENKELVLLQYGDPEIQNTNFHWAFQNGMMLIIDGLNPHNEKSTNETLRSGIGFKKDGTLIYIKTDDPVTFHSFAKLFKDQGATNAIYLDGGIESVNGFGTIQKTDAVDSGRPVIQFFDPTRRNTNNLNVDSGKLKVRTNN